MVQHRAPTFQVPKSEKKIQAVFNKLHPSCQKLIHTYKLLKLTKQLITVEDLVVFGMSPSRTTALNIQLYKNLLNNYLLLRTQR